MLAGRIWTDDEFVVVLDLYLRVGPKDFDHPEVASMASHLRRTPDAIACRLLDFAYVDPDQKVPGLETGRLKCQPVWDDCRADLAGWPAKVAAARERLGMAP